MKITIENTSPVTDCKSILHLTKLIIIIMLLLLNGCKDYPKDINGTLNKITTSGVIKIGVIEHPPYASFVGKKNPEGSEIDLVTAFAKSLPAKIKWYYLGEHLLISKLQNREIDLVIGGLLDDNHWIHEVGTTRVYSTINNQNHVMAVPLGENAFIIKLEKFLSKQNYG